MFNHTKERSFSDDIAAMNTMYDLPVNLTPTLQIGQDVGTRLGHFKSILTKELSEIDLIMRKVSSLKTGHPFYQQAAGIIGVVTDPDAGRNITELEVLTDLADLFADLQVYCASEMIKFGIPINTTLQIVMDSNFSKLGADGLPIKDAEGKFLKGPNYWKPEGKIEAMLKNLRETNSVVQLKSI
jgi:predicted HAD superfamily Cof-like phosphohydrolase